MAAGCVTVPAYVTNTERDHVHILDNSGARAVIVSNEKLLRPLHPSIQVTGIVEHVIGIEDRSEEHTSALQSLMRISYAVFCLKKNKQTSNKILNNKTSTT